MCDLGVKGQGERKVDVPFREDRKDAPSQNMDRKYTGDTPFPSPESFLCVSKLGSGKC